MTGEENGQLIYAKQFVENLESKNLKFPSETDVHGAFQHHPIPSGAMICPIQQLFEVMNPPPSHQLFSPSGYDDSQTIFGFKFIRFQDVRFGGKDVESAVQFLQEYFPCARFIINIRGDIASQKESWKKAFKPANEKVVDELPKMNEILRQVASLFGIERARLIDMDDWSNEEESIGLKVLNDLVEWLGFKHCRFPFLLHENKDNYALDVSNTFTLGENCTFVGVQS